MKSSLPILLVWASLCVVWNLYGAVQIVRGGSALGPTATFAGAALAFSLGIAFMLSASRWPLVYRILACLAVAMAGFTIWNAFRLDPALWPSDFWRYAGIALNGLGVLGGLMPVFRKSVARFKRAVDPHQLNAHGASEDINAFIAIPHFSLPGTRSGKLVPQTVQFLGIRGQHQGLSL